MSRDGSGNYSLPVGNPVTTGTSISSSTHNSTMSDIATALTASLAKDGQTTPSANLPMGGYKHTGVATATARTDYCTAANAQDNAFDWLSSVSGADTITATAGLSMTAYASGQTFRFVSAGANTGAATLNLNAIGAKAITKNGTTALIAGDIPSGATVEVIYDGTRFQMVGCVANKASAGANTDITSLAGLTTPLSIAQGGTGADSEATVKAALNLENGTDVMAYVAHGTDGNVLTSNGSAWISETPVTYFVSAAQTITASGLLTIAHGLPATPSFISYKYKCKTAEGGWSIGDEVFSFVDSNYAAQGFIAYEDATNVYIRFNGTATPLVIHKTTGAWYGPTAANWELIVIAR